MVKLPKAKISAVSAAVIALIALFNGQDFIRVFVDAISIIRPA